MKKQHSILVFLILLASGIFAQQNKDIKFVLDKEFSKEYTFDKEDLKQDILIFISSDINEVNFRIKGKITFGEFDIEILDPNNKHEGSLELKTDSKSKSSIANGNFHKSLDNPIEGDWIIRIAAKNTIGELTIEVNK